VGLRGCLIHEARVEEIQDALALDGIERGGDVGRGRAVSTG
jgi:hypothetical protein